LGGLVEHFGLCVPAALVFAVMMPGEQGASPPTTYGSVPSGTRAQSTSRRRTRSIPINSVRQGNRISKVAKGTMGATVGLPFIKR
jgi:hypothetical protein